MNINVLLFGNLGELATHELIVPLAHGSRLTDLIQWLASKYGDTFREEIRYLERFNIMINGRYVQYSMEMPLKEGDLVAIMPVIIGG